MPVLHKKPKKWHFANGLLMAFGLFSAFLQQRMKPKNIFHEKEKVRKPLILLGFRTMVRMFITQVTKMNPSAVYIPVRPLPSFDLYELYHNIKLEAIQNEKTYY